MAVKMPAGHAAGQVTEFHQDWPNFPFDRTGMITFWIALADMPAEQGVMRPNEARRSVKHSFTMDQ